MSQMNITIPDELRKQLKVHAAKSDKTMLAVVITAITEYLSTHPTTSS